MTLHPSNAILSTSASQLSGCLTSDPNPSSAPRQPNLKSRYEIVFNQLVDAISQSLSQPLGLHFTVSLAGEESQFTRFNGAKVRQSGLVCDGQLRLTLMSRDRTTTTNIPFTGGFTADWAVTQQALDILRADLPRLPVDPYVVLPAAVNRPASNQSDRPQTGLTENPDCAHSREVNGGSLLPENAVATTLLEPVKKLDFSGLYAGGITYRAYGDSAGKRHWFETRSYTLDYSLFGKGALGESKSEPNTGQHTVGDGLGISSQANGSQSTANQAVKGTLASHTWNPKAYRQTMTVGQQQLTLLARPVRVIPKGRYRTYLAPAAVADLMDALIGEGLGEASLRQGNSAFGKLEAGQATLSEKFSLEENFQRTSVPRFNSNGAIAPARLPIIQQGRWANALVNARSAKEYGKPSNAANASESMRAPAVAPGQLKTKDILTELDTGLYVSNLHYLNWSDLVGGRITGMTRYACFWVEAGEIVAPIENLRFDDTLYRFLGEGLLALTEKQTFLPAVSTYDRRSLGGMWVPGMLIDQFRYTL